MYAMKRPNHFFLFLANPKASNLSLPHRCDCSKGFTGPRCEININECESNPCHNQGTCLDERGAFRCVCMPGESLLWVLWDGDTCRASEGGRERGREWGKGKRGKVQG